MLLTVHCIQNVWRLEYTIQATNTVWSQIKEAKENEVESTIVVSGLHSDYIASDCSKCSEIKTFKKCYFLKLSDVALTKLVFMKEFTYHFMSSVKSLICAFVVHISDCLTVRHHGFMFVTFCLHLCNLILVFMLVNKLILTQIQF
jgi:hypothetical protein